MIGYLFCFFQGVISQNFNCFDLSMLSAFSDTIKSLIFSLPKSSIPGVPVIFSQANFGSLRWPRISLYG